MSDYTIALSEAQRLALQTLRPILLAAGQPEPDMRKITITENTMVEFSVYDGLTQAILDHDTPKISTTTVLDHYTTGGGFRGIMERQELHLAPVSLRLAHGELGAFAVEHGLNGYVDSNGSITDLMREASKDLFYSSFHRGPPSDGLWSSFGDNGAGYRLRFEITPAGVADLREIRYQGKATLLRQVNDALAKAGLPRFVMKGVSRLGAFHLAAMWRAEEEVRLLAKRFEGGGAPVVTGGAYDYWPVSIDNADSTATLKLIEIGVRKRSATSVAGDLPGWAVGVSVVGD